MRHLFVVCVSFEDFRSGSMNAIVAEVCQKLNATLWRRPNASMAPLEEDTAMVGKNKQRHGENVIHRYSMIGTPNTNRLQGARCTLESFAALTFLALSYIYIEN